MSFYRDSLSHIVENMREGNNKFLKYVFGKITVFSKKLDTNGYIFNKKRLLFNFF